MTTIRMLPQKHGQGPPAPVPVYQWHYEFEMALTLYRAKAPMRTLEVGTYHGGTLYHWLQNAQPGATVVSLDSYAVGVDNRAHYASWCQPGVEVIALQGNSNDPAVAAEVGLHGPYDWIWIDAGHYYHEVKADWDLYRPLCASGGVVCLHDILPPSHTHPEIQVSWLWEEIKPHYETVEYIQNPDIGWGGIGVVAIP